MEIKIDPKSPALLWMVVRFMKTINRSLVGGREDPALQDTQQKLKWRGPGVRRACVRKTVEEKSEEACPEEPCSGRHLIWRHSENW